jgi:uncharacterized membrane protein YgcG
MSKHTYTTKNNHPCTHAHAVPIAAQALRPQLSAEQQAQLEECFQLMDADGSGAIDADELDAAFKAGQQRGWWCGLALLSCLLVVVMIFMGYCSVFFYFVRVYEYTHTSAHAHTCMYPTPCMLPERVFPDAPATTTLMGICCVLRPVEQLLGLQASRAEVSRMLDEVDADGSGEVEYPEFVQIMSSSLKRLSERRAEPQGGGISGDGGSGGGGGGGAGGQVCVALD